MSFEQQTTRALGRVRNFAAAAAAAISFAVLGAPSPAVAQQNLVDSYNFQGLSWGMKMADARKALANAGYKVTAAPAGKRREFAIDRLHAVFATIDRGKRIVAVGRFEGYPVTVELAFGKKDSLNHVYVMSSYWNRTLPGARALITQAEKTVAALEKRYGPAKKRVDDRWPDTAYWGSSKDGSTLSVHVRGINGFMFSPSYTTALRIDYANAKFNGGQVAGVKMDLTSTGWTDGPSIIPAATTSLAPKKAPGGWVDESFIGR